jgi:hypothetical protein
MTANRHPIRTSLAALAALTLAVSFAGCSAPEPTLTGQQPEREPIAVYYVSATEFPLHQEPSDDSPVVAKFRSGEAVTVYAEENGWVEIMRGTGDTAWGRAELLEDSKEVDKYSTPENVEFRIEPASIYRPSVRGEIAFELMVSKDGNVMSARTLRNTTGSKELEDLNRAEVMNAKFFPMREQGRRKAFIYEHRIRY